jgi:hypothetical protein
MASRDQGEHQRIVDAAIDLDEVASAVVFIRPPGSASLELSAAAGIDGPALERLASAVGDPNHPISRTLADHTATYDVAPTAPGGPALRSHLPLMGHDGDRPSAVGVLAVAHEHRLSPEARQVLEDLANRGQSG